MANTCVQRSVHCRLLIKLPPGVSQSIKTVPGGVREYRFYRCVRGKLGRVPGTRRLGNRCVPADFGASGTRLGALARTLMTFLTLCPIFDGFCQNKLYNHKEDINTVFLNMFVHKRQAFLQQRLTICSNVKPCINARRLSTT